MKKILARIVGRISAQLGHCPKCMRTAFRTALGAWIAVLALHVSRQPVSLLVTGAVVAGLLTTLWCAHILTYVTRGFVRTLSPDRARKGDDYDPVRWSRRRMLASFTGALFFTAYVTAIPGAYADDCGCPADAPKCTFNPMTRQWFCCGSDDTPCSGPDYGWCCPGDKNCYGDHGHCR